MKLRIRKTDLNKVINEVLEEVAIGGGSIASRIAKNKAKEKPVKMRDKYSKKPVKEAGVSARVSRKMSVSDLKEFVDPKTISRYIQIFKIERHGGGGAWITGVAKGDIRIKVAILVFTEGSQFGINKGKVSKLWLFDRKSKKTLANYDRGWDVKPDKSVAKWVTDLVKNIGK